MVANKLPMDDVELEIEDLIAESSNGVVRKRSSQSDGITSADRRCRLQCACLSMILACALAIFWPVGDSNMKGIRNTEVETDTDGASLSDATPIKGYAWPLTPFAVRTENPPPQAVLDEYAQTWGTWQLGELPKMDRDVFCGTYSHCDVPRDKLPPDAWQADSAFVTKFLDEADKLVDRAMHAILAEYGKSPDDTVMFDLTYMDLKRRELREQPTPNNGGWTTKRSMQGLSRRLLHAIMTRDTFTFIMGGHLAAAGHG
jgi:hypothetical protein